ncbi:MAG: DUF1109 domain-containing protein [Caulobacteraceae bacterium]|nr:DUF1109 domain-containing protein [Caulobacteraceae bacterium]
MKTDELIALMSTDVAPVSAGAVGRRMASASLAAAGLALMVLMVWLGLRHDLMGAMHTGPFWMKAGYTIGLTVGGLMLVERLARPGTAPGSGLWVLAAAFMGVTTLGAINLALSAPRQWAAAWLGDSWTVCPFRILIISAPAFAAIIWGLKRFAPTRLALTGAAAGLLAGGIGATIYGLHCNESTAAFVATWYTLGIAACAGIGALLGPRLLRW